MDKKIKWGILGPGSIANKFATGLKVVSGSELYAVGSRDITKAQIFANKYDVPKAYGSYKEMLEDPQVDIVYVATPHVFHKECTLLCLNHGKGVLCEKPFAVNVAEAREMIACARKNRVFLMEAMWTRYLPVMAKVMEWVKRGMIGKIKFLTADFGFRADVNPKSRLFNIQLGGGALLDVGVYPINFSSMILNDEPSEVVGVTRLGETGVDEDSAMILKYPKGPLAVLHAAVRTTTLQEARIIGTNGTIIIPDFWMATTATLQVNGKEPEKIAIPFDSNGYCYEAREAEDCIRKGKLQSELMTWDESIAILKIMDKIREQWGLIYPSDSAHNA